MLQPHCKLLIYVENRVREARLAICVQGILDVPIFPTHPCWVSAGQGLVDDHILFVKH